jgi:hypothetical protein
MGVKMVTYIDPRSFLKGFKKEYWNAIHVCATKSLTEAVRNAASIKDSGYKGSERKIISAALLIGRLLGSWSKTPRKLSQYANLSEILRDERKMAREENKDILKSFRLNQADVLQTMRILAEVKETPHSLKAIARTKEELEFARIWARLEEQDESFEAVRFEVNQQWADKNNFKKKLLKVLSEDLIGLDEIKSWNKKILLHGFYFMTPIQHKIFTLLRDAGYELIFINLYDPKFPEIFKSVRGFISSKIGFTDEWEIEMNNLIPNTLGTKFASAFNYNKSTAEDAKGDKSSNKFLKASYSDFYEFLDDYDKEAENNQTIFLSPSHKDVNERLKEFYPEYYQRERHLLSYPLGQFLFHLHNMWDENEETLILNQRALAECFSSGWLFDKETKENALNFTGLLQDILPYFQNCQTCDDWSAAMVDLWEIRSSAVSQFEKYNPDGNLTDRFHQMLENPFSRFSYLNISVKDVKQVIRFIYRLLFIARFLFEKGDQRISLHEHFERLKEVIYEGNRESLEPEEQRILDELLEKLHDSNMDEAFLVQDLSEAIAFFLKGGIELEEEEPDPDPQPMHPSRIFSLQDIDGKIIEAALYKKKIHVCALDEDSLPQAESALPWPLTKLTLERMQSNLSVSMLLLKENLKSEISRYLFYSLTNFTDDGKISWMEKWNGKERLEESFYVLLLNLEKKRDQKVPEVEKTVLKAPLEYPISKTIKHFNHYPTEAINEYFFCQRRFFYSFLSMKYPAYQKDLHHEYLFGSLVKKLGATVGANKDKVIEQLSLLFPQWTELRKKILVDENFKSRFFSGFKWINRTDSRVYDEIEYPATQRQFQFLLHKGTYRDDPEISDKWLYVFGVEEDLKDEFEKLIIEETSSMMTSDPSFLCRFCPHAEICPDYYFPVDDRFREMEQSL